MSIPVDEFWQRLYSSQWLAGKKIASIRSQIEAKAGDASAEQIGRILIRKKLLTKPQVQRLLANELAGSSIQPNDAPSDGAAPIPIAVAEHQPRSQEKQKPFGKITLMGLFIAIIATGGIVFRQFRSGDPGSGQTKAKQPPTRQDRSVSDEPPTRTEIAQTPWARQHDGQPIDLPYAPLGVQTIVRLRPSALLSLPSGAKALRSLGPRIEKELQSLGSKIGLDLHAIETLYLYLLPQGTVLPQTVAVGEWKAEANPTLAAKLPRTGVDGPWIRMGADVVWFPAGQETVFVTGPAQLVESLMQSAEPTLRRELDQLRRKTHDTDHLTILSNPNFLRDEAQGLFSSSNDRLLGGLYEFWSDDAQAISIGVQLTEIAVAEVRIMTREDTQPRQLASHVRNLIDGLPAVTGDYLGRVELDPYWQKLALRFPGMLRFVAEHTRIGVEEKMVTVSTAVPADAVHNILLAAELSLASHVRTRDGEGVDRSDSGDHSTWTIHDVLAWPATLGFSQTSLEQAIREIEQLVSDELSALPFAFEIEILGSDLEQEGITRNQQIHQFRHVQRPLAEVLTSLARQANPVQTVSSPTDSNQKLIWAIDSDTSRVLITTRSAANARNIRLPSVFVAE